MNKETQEVAVSPLEISSTALATVMKGEAEKRALITQYISQHMVSGTDYGTIKFGGKESKPSLFKPGSEKFLSLFKLTAQFEKDTDTWEMAGSESGVFAYKCRLLDSKRRLVGEGRGVSKLTEKAGWTINNAVKIAEKRAQTDAVLRTGALSDFFTQDLEDMKPEQYDQSPIAERAVPTVTYDDPEVKSDPAPWKKKSPSEMAGVSRIKALKQEIKDIADKTVLSPLETKEKYEDWVFEMTSFDLTVQTEENLQNIINELKKVLQHETSTTK